MGLTRAIWLTINLEWVGLSPVGPTTALRQWPRFSCMSNPDTISSYSLYERVGRTKTRRRAAAAAAIRTKMGRSVLSHFLSLSTNPPRFSAPLSETLTLLPPFPFPLLLKESSFFFPFCPTDPAPTSEQATSRKEPAELLLSNLRSISPPVSDASAPLLPLKPTLPTALRAP